MDQIKIMGDIPHIRLRPGMYIGSTYSPDHLLDEILDNSLDELIAGRANTITIDIDNGHAIVTDNGNGIPNHPVIIKEGTPTVQNDGKTIIIGQEVENSIIVACTVLKSGSKFDAGHGKTIGLHGYGLVAVNALSKTLRISVKDKTNPKLVHDYQFVDAQLVEQTIIEFDVPWSTRIEFQIDPKYFTVETLNPQKFEQRLQLVSAKYPLAKLYLNNNIIKIKSFDDWTRNLLDLRNDLQLFTVNLNNQQIELKACITYDTDGYHNPDIRGDINLRMCGGTYLTNITTLFVNAISEEYESFALNRNEILSYFRCYASIFIDDPEFDSQSKNNMISNISNLIVSLKNEFSRIAKTSLVKQTVQYIVDKKVLKKASKKSVKLNARVSTSNPLKNCLINPGEILYLMEGKSADGTLGKIRNRRTEAILPISGKILNVVKSSVDKALDSKKFTWFREAVGINIGKNQSQYRFKQFKMLCDADPDGMHIVVLLILAFWKYAPALIQTGKVSVIIPPLYGVNKGKTFIPIYHHEDLVKYQGYDIQRYKGIGEMNPSQLKVVVKDNPIEYIVQPPANKRDEEAIISCVTDTELKRRLCLEVEKFNLSRLFPQTV